MWITFLISEHSLSTQTQTFLKYHLYFLQQNYVFFLPKALFLFCEHSRIYSIRPIYFNELQFGVLRFSFMNIFHKIIFFYLTVKKDCLMFIHNMLVG